MPNIPNYKFWAEVELIEAKYFNNTNSVAAFPKVLWAFPFWYNISLGFVCIALINNLNAGPLSSAKINCYLNSLVR